MSNNQVVVDTLLDKRDKLIAEQRSHYDRLQDQINEIEDALDKLAGKSVWRPEKQEAYDDENHGYISGTEDGI